MKGGKQELIREALERRKQLAVKSGCDIREVAILFDILSYVLMFLSTQIDAFMAEFNSMRRMMMQNLKVRALHIK